MDLLDDHNDDESNLLDPEHDPEVDALFGSADGGAARAIDGDPQGVRPKAFDAIRDDPRRWAASAEQLFRASGLLESGEQRELFDALDSGQGPPNHTYVQVVLLLAGLALENLLKALYVCEPRNIPQSKLGELDTHDLVELAGLCGLQLAEDEVDLLHGLGRVVKWAGRYPLGKNPSDTPRWLSMGTAAVTQSARLYGRLRESFDARCPVRAAG